MHFKKNIILLSARNCWRVYQMCWHTVDASERGNSPEKIFHLHLLWWKNKLKWRILHKYEKPQHQESRATSRTQGECWKFGCFPSNLCSACGLDNSWTAPSTCDVNLQIPTSLQVLNVAAYSCRELLDTRCVCLLLCGTVKCPHSSMQHRVHSSFWSSPLTVLSRWGSLTPPPARIDLTSALKKQQLLDHFFRLFALTIFCAFSWKR